MGWYGFGRMLIEGLRTDSLMIGDTIRVSQLIGALTFVAGVVLSIIFARIAKKRRIAMIDGAVPAVTEGECDDDCNCEKCEETEINDTDDTTVEEHVSEDTDNGEDN